MESKVGIKEIIQGLNLYFIKKYPNKGFFNFTELTLKNPKFKSYKHYTLTLFHINNNQSEEVFKIEITENTTDVDYKELLQKKAIVQLIFNLLNNIDKINNYGI